MHTPTRRPRRRLATLATAVTASALAASTISIPAMAAEAEPEADHLVGVEASDGSWLGPVLAPTEDGDSLGWGLDPGLPERMTGESDSYQMPQQWEGLDDEQRLQLIAALYFGQQAIEAGEAGEDEVDDEYAEDLLGTTDADAIAAGVAGIIYSVAADEPREGSEWDPEILDEESFDVYSNLLSGPGAAGDIDTSDIKLVLRSPSLEVEDNQRVVLPDDMELPWSDNTLTPPPPPVEEDGEDASESEAPEETEEPEKTSEAPEAEIADDAKRKTPPEHRKGPTSDRATIVSVPSGPTGDNPLE